MENLRPTGDGSGAGSDPCTRLAEAESEVARLRAEVARLRAERAVLWWATGHDELTGLLNRRLFSTLAGPVVESAKQPTAVLVMDLNGFKTINDSFGHAVGDRVLRIVARRLTACVGDRLVARLGGDEFAAVVTCPRPMSAGGWWHPTIMTLSALIAEPMPTTGEVLSVTASIGVAPVDGCAPLGELLHRADLAMYQAKASGRQDGLQSGLQGELRGELPAPDQHDVEAFQPAARTDSPRRQVLAFGPADW